MRFWKLAPVAGLLFAASPALPAVSVIGSGLARLCYEQAEAGRGSDRGTETCDRALVEEALDSRDRAATYVNRGILRMHGKRLNDALRDYEAALRLRPQLAEAHVNRGIALVHVGGRDAEAVAALSEALRLNTTRPEVAFYTRGVAYELLGNARAAYEDYRQAAALKPEWAEPRTQLQRFRVVPKRDG